MNGFSISISGSFPHFHKKAWIVDEEAAEVVREILCPTYHALEKGGKPRTALPPDRFTSNTPVVAKILDRMDYLGHTVNFKTHVKSYKQHKTIYNSPDQWKIFEDTHEAIIDKETFEIVQKIRELSQKKKRLAEIQKRIGELDTIFQRIYEDNITGKLSDERFMKISRGYDDEQHTLQTEADEIQSELQQEERKSVDVKRSCPRQEQWSAVTGN